jgi:adenine-specific DNA-methyltransferase
MEQDQEKQFQSRIKQLEKEVERLKKSVKQTKYGLVWMDAPESFEKEAENKLPILKEIPEKAIVNDDGKPTHILIEGDNYHALTCLNYTHKGKIDVIYIDPPYNTGAKDWKYNNNYVDKNDPWRHSKWICWMANRLHLAKRLLKENGVLICAIDENEQSPLGLLLEQIFSEHEIHCITIVHNPRGVQGKNFSYTHEYAFFVFRKNRNVIGERKIKHEDIYWSNLRNWGGESKREDAKNCFYPVIIENDEIVEFGDVVPQDAHPLKQTESKGKRYYVYPIDKKGVERKWRYARQSVEEVKDYLRPKKTRSGYEIEIGKDFGIVKTVWQDSRYDANEYGTKIVSNLVPDNHFDFPKSVFNTYDCIAPILTGRKKAIVLDYFAGSGTTGHAVMIMNKEDGGNRQVILCTNNENNICTEVCHPRIKKVIEGHDNYPDITKIPSNLKYYKTGFIGKNNPLHATDADKVELAHQAGDLLALAENTLYKLKENKFWQLYENAERYTAVYFREELVKFDEFVSLVENLEYPATVYVFSWGDEEFTEEFEHLRDVKVKTIPLPILEIYKNIYNAG